MAHPYHLPTSSLAAIAVLGPTCVGKTALGIKIAQAIDGEVISIDSLQCYRAGAITTAQPTLEERAEVAHHLVGYLDACEEPHIDFTDRVQSVLADLRSRFKIPVLVGGSTSLLQPVLDDMLRCDYELCVLVLRPHLQGAPYEDRIGLRLDDMVRRGMLKEMEELYHLERTSPDTQATDSVKGVWKTIGYPELRSYIAYPGLDAAKRKLLLDDALYRIRSNSLQYARHQLKWMADILFPELRNRGVPITALDISDFSTHAVDMIACRAVNLAKTFIMDKCPSDPVMELTNTPSLFDDFGHPCITHTHLHAACTTRHTQERKPAIYDQIRSNAPEKQRVVCVFAGSSPGASSAHMAAARSLAHTLHCENIHLVYGGGTTGLMGVLASTLVSLSGPSAVHGIIPRALAQYEENLTGYSVVESHATEFGERTIVPDMHTRKKMMLDRVVHGSAGSGFIALSGGYGTLEEVLEMVTWKQLGIHGVNVCVLNSEGFYDGFIAWLRGSVVGGGFVQERDAEILGVADTPDMAVEMMFAKKLVGRTSALRWD